MTSCPLTGFAKPNAATILTADQDVLNLTHIIPIPASTTHVHYQAFVNIKGDGALFSSLYPPLVNATLKWDPDAAFGPPSPGNADALPAWLPLDRNCPGLTAVYHTWPVADILLDGREATTDYITADWYYIRSDDGATTGPNHLDSSTFIVLKAPAAPPPPASSTPVSSMSLTPSAINTSAAVPNGQIESGSASTSSEAASMTGQPIPQTHDISSDAALALEVVIPVLVVGLVVAGWTWWLRWKRKGKNEKAGEQRTAQGAGAIAAPNTMRFEKAELEGNTVVVAVTNQPQELEEWTVGGTANEQNNRQLDHLEGIDRVDRGRVMSFELEAPPYSGGRAA